VEKRPEQTGYIIATRRLTDEPWESIDFGELTVFKYGQMVYSNCRDVSETLKVSFMYPTKRTATKDLTDLVNRELLERHG